MSINVKNITTGEIVKVNNVQRMSDGRVVAEKANPQPRHKFYEKYTFLTDSGERFERTIEGDRVILCVVFTLAEGYEVIVGRTPKTTSPESPVDEMEVVINPDELVEVTEEPKKVEEPKKAAPEMPQIDAAQNAFTAAFMPLFSGVAAQVEASIMAKVQPILDRAPVTVTHVIKSVDTEYKSKAGEVFHPNFDAICARIKAGMWVYLYGPTGSGKNVMAEQIAKALGLEFHYLAHTLDRFELTGFIDASGCYQPTEFYKAYTEGGLFMLDELDASDENALITLNSAANGYFAFPCGTVKAHPNFRCIAAGNTCGRGATDDYTARRVMDASSLGRFTPRFHGYCNEIDLASAGGNNELVDFFHSMRKIKESTGGQMLLSPRQIKSIAMLEGSEELSQIMTDILCTYLTEDEFSIICNALHEDDFMRDNRYAKAFKKAKTVKY